MDKAQSKNFTFGLNIKSIEDSQDPSFGIIEGYGSVFGNIDSDDDLIERGAFTEALKKRTPKMLWQHRMDKPIGVWDEVKEDERGLYLKGRIFKETALGKDAFVLLKGGAIEGLSIGFSFFGNDVEFKDDVRIIKKIDELFETSIVTIPANSLAGVSSVKAVKPNKNLPIAARDREWNSTDAIERVREFSGSMEEPSSTYKDFFMFYDANKVDDFGSYKLPFVDIIDGEPHIIPRGIFAIAGVLEGARSGVDIPESEQDKIKVIVTQCYERMAEQFNDSDLVVPFAKSLNIEEISSLKEVEKTFKEKGFSNKESKTLISKIKEFSLKHQEEEEKQRDADNLALDEILTVQHLTNIKSILNKN